MSVNAYFLFCGCLVLIIGSDGAPIIKSANKDDFALKYFAKYGYMSSSAASSSKSGSLMSQESFIEAIKDFQTFAKINVTGELDKETMELMQLPRCGVKDFNNDNLQKRKKRYVLQGSRWKVKALTYQVSKYPTDSLSESDVQSVLTTAFQAWADVSELTFAPAKSGEKVHIDIRFETSDHDDGDPFDGAGGTLAHAYFPVYGGDVHFDNEEKWSTKTYRGTNFLQVSAHELGHSLGLSHSDERDALMGPFYRGYDPNFHLNSDDIKGIQALYGANPANPPEGQVGSRTGTDQENAGGGGGVGVGNSELCDDPNFDAIINLGDEKTYVFKGNNYFRLVDDQVEEGYPKSILEDFGIEGDVDAAFTWKNKRTYVFKGDRYWRLTDLKLDSGYPKPITDGFKGIPNSVDAAFVWSGNDKIYFMKDSDYWKFDPSASPPVQSIYPKKINTWKGLPDNIDAALQDNNKMTYFFKDGLYYRFNDKQFAVDTADPPFPRPTGQWWFSCPELATLKKSQGLRRALYDVVQLFGKKGTRNNSYKNTIHTKR